MTVRLMTWNIKHGGGSRLPAIIDVIRRERPDVLCLQELQDFRRYGHRRLSELTTATGMTAHLAPSAFAQPVAVLVRPPLRITHRSSVTWRLHHAAAVATVPTAAGPLRVISVHLNPFSPYRRYREARWLAAHYALHPRPQTPSTPASLTSGPATPTSAASASIAFDPSASTSAGSGPSASASVASSPATPASVAPGRTAPVSVGSGPATSGPAASGAIASGPAVSGAVTSGLAPSAHGSPGSAGAAHALHGSAGAAHALHGSAGAAHALHDSAARTTHDRAGRGSGPRRHAAGGLVLIAGDMNGLDPFGDHERELAALPSLYRQRHLAPDGTADTRAIAAFHEEGYTDLWHTAGEGDGRTVPTDYAGREFGAVRLDYMMASPALATRTERLWSVRDEATATASDHYPVRADVDL